MRSFLMLLSVACATASVCSDIKAMYRDKTILANAMFEESDDSCCQNGSISRGSLMRGVQKLLKDMGPIVAKFDAEDVKITSCSTDLNTVESYMEINSHLFDLELLYNLPLGEQLLPSFAPLFANPQLNPTNVSLSELSNCALLNYPQLSNKEFCYKMATHDHMTKCMINPREHRGKSVKSLLRILPVLGAMADALTPAQCAAPADQMTGMLCLMKHMEGEDKNWNIPCVVWLNQPLPPGAQDFINLWPVSPTQNACWATNYELLAHSRCHCLPFAKECNDDICTAYKQCPFTRTERNPGVLPGTTTCTVPK